MAFIVKSNVTVSNLRVGPSSGGSGGGYSVPIESTGLKLWWDAGDVNSYSGTGTTITDLSGTGFDGEIIGSPTFVSDGESSYFSILNPNTGSGGTPYLLENYIRGIGGSGTNPFSITYSDGYTFSLWMQINSSGGSMKFQESAGFGSSNSSFKASPAAKYGRNDLSSSASLRQKIKYGAQNSENFTNSTTTSWVNAAIVVSAGTSYTGKLYMNGSEAYSQNLTRVYAGTEMDTVLIGTDIYQWHNSYSGSGETGYALNGKWANVAVYNRPLSATEVLSNYNALSSRF